LDRRRAAGGPKVALLRTRGKTSVGATFHLRREGLVTGILLNYLPIVIFLALASVIGSGFLIAAWVVAPKSPDKEKVSAYECGFNAFDDARMKFDVRYYLVSILFIIFDLEIAFLFPFALTLKQIGPFGYWSVMAFLGVLTVGLVYEWSKGALEWE
jgi:NADH-quinone oxidoreductase subunit A